MRPRAPPTLSPTTRGSRQRPPNNRRTGAFPVIVVRLFGCQHLFLLLVGHDGRAVTVSSRCLTDRFHLLFHALMIRCPASALSVVVASSSPEPEVEQKELGLLSLLRLGWPKHINQ